MKDHPIKYIKSFGFKLWLTQINILILNKLKILNSLKNKLSVSKNKQIKKYLEKKYNYIINKYKTYNSKESPTSKNIWIFWWQGIENAPGIVKNCINSIKKYMPNYNIVIITQNNINNYYQIPDFIKYKLENKQLTFTTFSDILRMNLLKTYGGFWMDATIFLTDNPFKEINENEFYTIKFHTDEKTSISKGKWCGFFIGGNNQPFYEFMTDFFNEYFKKEKLLIDYFLIDYTVNIAYQTIETIKNKFDSVKYNNEQIHKLQSLLNNKFDENEYKKLLKTNCVHKLSFKSNIEENEDNFYNKIVKQASN